jgi:hypothetical protein
MSFISSTDLSTLHFLSLFYAPIKSPYLKNYRIPRINHVSLQVRTSMTHLFGISSMIINWRCSVFFFFFFFLIKENLLDWQKWIACTSNTCFCTMLWYQCLELFFIWNRLHNVCLPKWIEAGRAFVLYNNKND